MSQQIIPYAKSILGVDISQGMVDLYNETGQKEGFDGMKAVRTDLKGEEGELNGQKFNVIIVSVTQSGRANVWLNFAAVQHGVSPFRRCGKGDEDPCWIIEARRETYRQ